MLPAIYQSNFHPTAFLFLIGKNERKTYTTLIRRMHSLGRGEGRAGWLSNSKYMHWLQDEIGLGSRFERKLCRWAAWLSETVQGQVLEGRRWGATEALLTWPCQCVLNLFCGGLLPGNKEKMKERKRQKTRERERKKEREREMTEREKPPLPPPTNRFPETWCKVH